MATDQNEEVFSEFCVWDNQKHHPHREGVSEAEAHEWVAGWLRRRSIIEDIATSPPERFTVRSRQITVWSEDK